MDQLSDEQLQRSTEQLQTAVRQLQLETDVFERFLQRVDPWEHAASAAPAASSVQSATPSISPAQSASDVSTSDQSARSTLRGARRAGKPSGKTAKVEASGLKSTCRVRVMCDSGSNATFIRSDTAHMLGCRIQTRQPLQVSTFGGGKASHQLSEKVEVGLTTQDGSLLRVEAYKIPNICGPPPVIGIEEIQLHEHLRGLKLAEEPGAALASGGEIEILLGQDVLQDVFDGDMRVGQSGPMAISSRFGWIVCGRSGCATPAPQEMMANFVHTETESVKATLDDLWTLEGIGISSDGVGDGSVKKTQEAAALQQFNETCTRLPDGRYQNRWPWKHDTGDLPSNEAMALSRLEACERSLRKTGKLRQYDNAIQDYIDQGHAEEAPQIPTGKVHLLPHHAVFKGDKIRIVFDAAAGHPNSLNDHVLSGPNMIADLTGVLLRFRTRRIGVTADIEKAFLQLALHPDDRDVTRFLWRKDASDLRPTTYRMTRVVFGVTASPFLLQASVRQHLQQYEEADGQLVARLRRDLYCDDLITSVNTQEEAEELSQRTQEIFNDAKMNMRHWTYSFETDKEAHKPLGEEATAERKVLGICWIPGDDQLVFKTAFLTQLGREAPETKRNILSVSARFYDPLGLLVPFLVRAKLLLKRLWIAGHSWDQTVASDVRKDWRKWLLELEQIDGFSIPRPYATGGDCGYQLHMFCDASMEAMAAAVYVKPEDNSRAPTLVMAKARLAPRQAMSVPRLELTAAVIGARLVTYVQSQLDITTEISGCWTDSMVALHWIRSNSQRWGVYVRNRINEIQSLCPPTLWKHVPGNQNPADLPSKGVPAAQLRSSLWLHGPEWLEGDNSVWPPQTPTSNEPAECTVEAKKMALTTVGTRARSTGIGQVMDINRYSSWRKLIRITAWVLRWARGRSLATSLSGPLSTSEISTAERLWVMDAQRTEYGQDLDALQAGLDLPRQSSLKALNPVLEEGILRKDGRLQYSSLSEEEIRPVILPPGHRLVYLLAMKIHEELCHAGVQQVVDAIRDRYWITRGRQTVRASLNQCRKCHLFRAQPFAMRPAPLPRSRVTAARPFSCTGIDYAGPLYVKRPFGSEPEKVYIAVFTCAVTRALHLELVGSLRTEDFLRAYRRFAARRLSPTSIISDNATYFKAASAVLATEGVSWSFIVERAPWWGGFWESMVKLTKHALRRTLGAALLSWEELETVLCSVEGAINERPLTQF
ncbi:hypothetical protein FJT64_018671 [Amphibalanus amphitrite]|uniref:Integrase catalytic domain-containing protein n=1 Tax=Amphibalanus amphitrite TaxID=1232801 RepID=A0A6A4WS78_AMPAM|nr:hypothetical protein FJT64_018671 [Amphibalanus amphitrite]